MILFLIIGLLFASDLLAQQTTPPQPPALPQQFVQRSNDADRQNLYRIVRIARKAEDRNDLERALELWRQANEIRPGYYSAYHGIKRSLLALNRYDEAMDFLDEMFDLALSGKASLDPISVSADKVEVVFASEGREKGFDALEKILDRYKGNEKVYRELSNVLASQRLSDEAIAMLHRGREESGDPYMFARDLARWCESRMDWESAVKEYLLLLEESDANLSYVTGAFGDMLEDPHADSLMVKVLSEKIKSVEGEFQNTVRKLLASLHFRAQRYKESLEQYQILERETGGQGRELLEFAELTYTEGEYELSWQAYNEILAGNPQRGLKANVLLGKGRVAEGLNQIDSAVAAYNGVLEPGVLPKDAFEAYYRLARVNFDHYDDSQKARELFEKAKDFARKARVSYSNLYIIDINIALTFEREGDFEKAEDELQSAIRHGGRYRDAVAKARYELIKLYYRQGEYKKAEKEIQALLIAAPSSPEANETLELKALFADLEESPDVIKALGSASMSIFRRDYEDAAKILNWLKENSPPRGIEEARWELFRIHVRNEDYDRALTELDGIIALENALKTDLALLKAGDLAGFKLQDGKAAAEYYEKLLIDFPDSPLADQARRRLKIVGEDLM